MQLHLREDFDLHRWREAVRQSGYAGLALAVALDAQVVAFTALDYHLNSYFESTMALTL